MPAATSTTPVPPTSSPTTPAAGTTPAPTGPVFPLKAGTYTQGWSLDNGVDISTIGAACGPAAPLLAMFSGTIVSRGIGGFGNDAPTLKLDTPYQSYNYIYYGHSQAASPALAVGTHVVAGQVISDVGCGIVGISTGPHLEIGFATGPGALVGPGSASTMESLLHSAQVLSQPTSSTGVPGVVTGAAGATTIGGNTRQAAAAAFSTFINLPSIFDQAEALAFTGKRSFIADQPLLPFIEQLCQASLRNFMSMPNGNFFAFFPDYFGLFGRKYYWEIRDIEIIDGRIDFSDDPLVTHVAVAGDVTQYHGTVDVFDLLLTSGIFTILDAIATHYVGADPKLPSLPAPTTKANSKSKPPPVDKATSQEALAFLARYGARPYVEEAPMIRSPFFEMFLAFQKFMLLWSKQFQTTFTLTFMPELFPGGLVAFPDHNVQCYIEEVIHNMDYEQGFTTTVHLSSPTSLDGSRPLSRGLADQVIAK